MGVGELATGYQLTLLQAYRFKTNQMKLSEIENSSIVLKFEKFSSV